MSDEYQLRKDVDRFKKFLDQLEANISSKLDIDDFTISDWLDNYYTSGDIDTLLSNLLENIDENIDTDTILDALELKADTTYVNSQISAVSNAKADVLHYHGWVGKVLNQNVTLYVNETAGLCELKLAQSFGHATAGTSYQWHPKIIPQEYRPIGNAFGTMKYGSVLRIYADGTVGGYFPQTIDRQFTGLGSAMWHIGVSATPSNWYNHNNLTVTELSGQTQLTNAGSSWGGYFANKTDTSASSLSDLLDWDSPFRIEVDVVSFSGNVYFQIYDGTSNPTQTIQWHLLNDLGLTTNNHIIVNSDAETVIWDVDGEVVKTNETALSTSRIGFRLNAGASLTFKNFSIEQ